MSRLIAGDALSDDLEDYLCKDCARPHSLDVCEQCYVPILLLMIRTYPVAKEPETEFKQKLAEGYKKLKSIGFFD